MEKDAFVTGTVKFFCSKKSFGFVEVDGGGADVHLCARVLEGAFPLPNAGDKITGTIRMEPKGRTFSKVHSLESSSAPRRGGRRTWPPSMKPKTARPLHGDSGETAGTLKSFNAEKGYGFIACIAGYEDVFLHARTVRASGMSVDEMVCGLPLVVHYERNAKGAVATRIARREATSVAA